MLIEPLCPTCKQEIVDDVFITPISSGTECLSCRRSFLKKLILDKYNSGQNNLESTQFLINTFGIGEA